MLFLGTKKYPDECHYAKFIQSNGGSKNAATGEDYTYYFFDVKNSSFPEALDIFSQFFKEPLFTPSMTERELNAVDNEYKKNMSSESRAQTQIEKSYIAVPGSRLNRFSTGNLETLQIDGILDELRKYYDKFYSANVMSLVLVSRASLDELEELVKKNFADVVDKDLPFHDFSGETVFNREHSFGRIFKVVPEKQLKNLTLKWQLPGRVCGDSKKSTRYLSHLIGHEGPNSLLSELIKEGLAQSLSAGSSDRLNQAITEFKVNITLTSQGE